MNTVYFSGSKKHLTKNKVYKALIKQIRYENNTLSTKKKKARKQN